MSAIYNLEPQPTGSVILHTTMGELSVELFAKQTPLTCRNFFQLCIDGYYDNTVFHRLVPGFILQGGDPTGTGNGGESIYDGGALSGEFDAWPMEQRTGKNAGPMGVGFRDEPHSRLKFARRGLLGMANEGTPNSNGSQFFFTLAKADELNGRNTVFGRVAGDTIYNLAKMGEAEVQQGTERPTYPFRIDKVEIVVNPFEGMERRPRAVQTQQQPKRMLVVAERKKKRKGARQLLSFADDEEAGEEEVPVLKKIKFDARIVRDVDGEDEVGSGKVKCESARGLGGAKGVEATKGLEVAKEEQKIRSQHKDDDGQPPPKNDLADDDDDAPMRDVADAHTHLDAKRSHSKQHATRSPPPPPPPPPTEPEPEPESEPEAAPEAKKSALERTNEEIAALKASMRRTAHTAEPVVKESHKSALERMIPQTSTRGRRRGAGGKMSISDVEDQKNLDMLMSFQSKLSHAAPPAPSTAAAAASSSKNASDPSETLAKDDGRDAKNDVDEEAQTCDLHFIPDCQSCLAWHAQDKQEESDDEGWMTHALTFQADRLGKDLSNRRKAEEELVVIDPREREQTLKEQKRAERQAKAGNSGREWDRGRDRAKNAELSRMSSMAGRGAR